MQRSLRRAGLAAVAGTALAVGLAPAASAAPAPGSLAAELTEAVTLDGVYRHLEALQAIGDANGNTRAIGTPGYDASVEYVAGQLRDAGFTVETPEFSVERETVDVESLVVAGAPVDVTVMTYSPNSPTGGATGPLAVAGAFGCEATDYAGADYAGTVALISRGTCSFAQKQATAAEAGAVAAVIYNNVPGALNGTLGDPDAGVIPTGGISQADGQALVAQAGDSATLDVQVTREEVLTRNVIAQTSTGRTDNVVMAGAHLDSVTEGPGINDNGSGSAGLLETALQLGPDPDVENAVRFAWWSAEELGLLGAEDYVANLDEQGIADIAAYLNFDMIGSDNAAYFVYDGDNSDGVGAGPGPDGSAAIEAGFVDYLAGIGIETEGTDFSGRSDYGPFIAVGIPAGGLFTGAEEIKTEDQAAKWGGEAGVAYDPCYHQACDVIENVNTVALEANSDALANSVAELATSTEAVNGEAPLPPAAEGPADLRAVVTAPLFTDLGAEVPVTVTVTNASTDASSGATTAVAIVTGRAITDNAGGSPLTENAVSLSVPQLAPGATATFELTAAAADSFRIGLAAAFVAPAPGQPDPELFNNIGLAAAITR